MQGDESNPNSFLEHMGIELKNWQEGMAEFRMPIQSWHMNRQMSLQGGVVATLIDAACGYAGLYSKPGEPQLQAVTITLNVNYVAGAKEGTLIAVGKRIGGGRTIFFAEAEVRTEAGVLIASGQASFKYRTSHS